MDRIQQRILSIAIQIPEYVGYQAKERRREEDRLVRRELAQKYEEQRQRLNRIARQAPIDRINDIENLDKKLQRLIARMRTALGGYAGWFDAGQIIEGDLDLLTEYDEALASGVDKVKLSLDHLAVAVKSTTDVSNAIEEIAEQFDTLNIEFDQREQFLSMGKKPSKELRALAQSSPLDALDTKREPSLEYQSLANLKIRDAISYCGKDLLVTGRISYPSLTGNFYAFMLQGTGPQSWLRVGPANRVALCEQVDFLVANPPPVTVEYAGQSYSRQEMGSANITVEGAGGTRRGQVDYTSFVSVDGRILWVENIGDTVRAMVGSLVDPNEFKIYRR